MLDLVRHGWVDEHDGDVVVLWADAPAEPHLLADASRAIRGLRGRYGIRGWVVHLPIELDPIQQHVARSLVERGVLGEKRRRLPGMRSRARFPELDPVPERHLRAHLAEALLGEREHTDDEALLIPLLGSYRLIDGLVPKDRRTDARIQARDIARRNADPGAARWLRRSRPPTAGVMTALPSPRRTRGTPPSSAATGAASEGATAGVAAAEALELRPAQTTKRPSRCSSCPSTVIVPPWRRSHTMSQCTADWFSPPLSG